MVSNTFVRWLWGAASLVVAVFALGACRNPTGSDEGSSGSGGAGPLDYASLFEEATNQTFLAVERGAAVFGDVDADGDPDLFVAGDKFAGSATEINGTSVLYTNDGGVFTEKTGEYINSGYGLYASFADVNGDDAAELFLTFYDDADNNSIATSFYKNNGTGDLSLPTSGDSDLTFNPFEEATHLLQDVTGDGHPDIIVSGKENGDSINAFVYPNAGDGTFPSQDRIEIPHNAKSAFVYGVYDGSASLGDFDGDGDPDLVLVGERAENTGRAKLFTNDGSGNFTEAADQNLTPLVRADSDVADIDGDGDPDLITVGSSSGTARAILYRNEGGTLNPIEDTNLQGGGAGAVAFVDVDLDGDPDLLLTGYEGSPSDGTYLNRLYVNDGTGRFTGYDLNLPALAVPSSGTGVPSANHQSIAIADVDGDGDPDVFITGRTPDDTIESALFINTLR